MKSYFAKLAARATLANAPSPAVTTSKSHDPFAEAEVSEPPPSSLGLGQPSHGPTQPVQPSRNQSLIRSEEVTRTQAERAVSETGQEKEQRSRSLTDRIQPPPTVQAALEITPAQHTYTPQARARRESQDVKPEAPPQVVSEEKTVARIVPPTIPKETTQSKPADADTDQTLEEIKREQTQLLRKADAFMAGLFERRSSQEIQREADAKDEKQARSYAEVSHEQPTRLPLPKAPQVVEVPDEQPSLVIGKLTVEVTPSAPPPVNPTPQVVVVRGPGVGRRRAGFSSSQRFGLGQF